MAHVRDRRDVARSGLWSVPKLTIHVSGVSQVHVTGSAEWQDLHISGVSGYHGLGVESTEAVVTASGVSVAELWVHDRLEVDGSGVSTIRYRGRPSVMARAPGEERTRSSRPQPDWTRRPKDISKRRWKLTNRLKRTGSFACKTVGAWNSC